MRKNTMSTMSFTVKGRESGKMYEVSTDSYNNFVNVFYGSKDIEQEDGFHEFDHEDKNGVYMVDDDSIETVIHEFPHLIMSLDNDLDWEDEMRKTIVH
jgi:hypothetical protein